MSDLTMPTTSRWQPQRLGLIDLFYYDNEEFPFVDGRLLLRGNNGTGKSKVLALTLPFLLDGDLSARRVEPDADPNKRMEWNLLLGGAHPHSERLGYAWIEFGRITEDGTPRFCTLGAGLKAVAGRGMAKHWFFLTSRRVGGDLQLLDDTQTALTRERLSEALGDHGRVYDSKRDYRRAVDETLFGLGERRYDALVDLLVQLRQPQLSKRPNEQALSDALTESLAPVRSDLIEYVAEGFRGLDDEREQLEQLADAARASEGFLEHYRQYAKVISRRRAGGPRQAQSRFEQLGRDLLRLRTELGHARRAVADARAELDMLRERAASLDAEYETLVEGEHADAEIQLMTAEREADSARSRAQESERFLERAERELAEAAEALEQVRAAAGEAAEQREIAGGEARRAAEPAGLAAQHSGLVDDLDVAVADAKRNADEVLQRRRRALTRVSELIAGVEAAERALAAAQQRLDDAVSVLDAARARLTGAEKARDEVAEALVTQVRSYLDTLVEVRVDDAASTLEDLRSWVATLDGRNPAATALGDAAERVRAALSDQRARARHRGDELAARADELTGEIAALEQGRSEPPPSSHTRDADAPGGLPFWQSVGFADGVEASDRAGLEAALEAAGLLDAHILPGAEVRAASDGEVLLQPSTSITRSTAGVETLAGPLVPELPPAPAGVSAADVAAVLSSIAVVRPGQVPDAAGQPSSWVSSDGRFGLGVATGAWSKPEASYIGEGAREAARQRRLAEARAQLETVHSEQHDVAESITNLDGRIAQVRRDVDGLPPDTGIRDAHSHVAAAQGSVTEASDRRDEAAAAVEPAHEHVRRSTAELAETASTLSLPTTRVELDEVRAAVEAYATALQQLWYAADVAVREHRRLAAAEADHRRADERHADAQQTNRNRTDDLTAARTRLETLESTVGADVEEFRRRRSAVTTARNDTKAALEGSRDALTEAEKSEAVAEERERSVTERQNEVAVTREQAVAALRRTVATGLVAVAVPELEIPDPASEWTLTQSVGLARAIEQELISAQHDDPAWERVQARLSTEFTTLQSALSRHGHSAVGEPSDDGYVVSVVFGGRTTPVADLVTTIRADIEARERMLGAREREIIENHLVTEVGANLADLVADAEAKLRSLNSELSERPTSTGMKLRVVWKTRRDGPAGLVDARKRLLQMADAWSEDDRTSIGAFLQARIADVRDADETGTWHEHLVQALDYRAWHHFTVERYQNGAWRPATGPASGGERVLAVSIPLFAAASSHYRTASKPHAARLVTLDEAFAGVDDDSRAKSLGLLHSFDLDVVMTSEREWGCYPEVPGLSIAQLARVEDIPAVLVTLWEWDGRARVRVERDDEPEPAPEGLWM